MTDELTRANLIVLGRVQGVFFRASTLEQAQQLGLVGWVKNLPEGSVEIVAEGRRYAIEELVTWCRQGPPMAKVMDVLTRWEEATEEFQTFRIE